jgi:D-sedoheptulose 7-phosphate isomerase
MALALRKEKYLGGGKVRREIHRELARSVDVLSDMAGDEALLSTVEAVANVFVEALRGGNKILFAGNGGSAADAQHLAAELVVRMSFDRPGLAALALSTDTSVLTAIGNDYGYEFLFARQVQAVGAPGDVFVAISTSGHSPNILRALTQARAGGLRTVGLTGASGGDMLDQCDYCFRVPSSETPKIQQGHIVIGHIICGLVEAEMFKNSGRDA